MTIDNLDEHTHILSAIGDDKQIFKEIYGFDYTNNSDLLTISSKSKDINFSGSTVKYEINGKKVWINKQDDLFIKLTLEDIKAKSNLIQFGYIMSDSSTYTIWIAEKSRKLRVKSGAELIFTERQKQLTTLGKTIEDDYKYNSKGHLLYAARILLSTKKLTAPFIFESCPIDWELGQWIKMCNKPYKERLIIAGALLAAELDRLNYKEQIENEK